MRFKNYAIATAALALIAVPAMASYGTFDLEVTSVNPGAGVEMYFPNDESFYSGDVWDAGVYNFDITNVQNLDPNFELPLPNWGFCIEFADIGQGPQPYEILDLDDAPEPSGPGGSPMGTAKAGAIAELWAANIDAALASSADAAAFQVAIWEIIYDDSGTWDVDYNSANKGDFAIKTNTANVVSTANTWLGNISGQGPKAALLYAYVSDQEKGSYQDFVVQVPAPAAILLGLIGLGLAGRISRRYA